MAIRCNNKTLHTLFLKTMKNHVPFALNSSLACSRSFSVAPLFFPSLFFILFLFFPPTLFIRKYTRSRSTDLVVVSLCWNSHSMFLIFQSLFQITLLGRIRSCSSVIWIYAKFDFNTLNFNWMIIISDMKNEWSKIILERMNQIPLWHIEMKKESLRLNLIPSARERCENVPSISISNLFTCIYISGGNMKLYTGEFYESKMSTNEML